jgi:hypothetical protein
VDLIGLPPLGQSQDTPGDDEMNDAHDIPEVERGDLTASSCALQRTPHELARELFDPDVRDVVPEDPRPDDLFAFGKSPDVLGDHRHFWQLGHLGVLLLDEAADE